MEAQAAAGSGIICRADGMLLGEQCLAVPIANKWSIDPLKHKHTQPGIDSIRCSIEFAVVTVAPTRNS